MNKKLLIISATVLALVASLVGPTAAMAQVQKPSRAPVVIPTGETEIEIGHSGSIVAAPIPKDFFDPNSDPFSGPIELCGGNLAGPDTIVKRLETIGPLFPGGSDTIPIEIIELRLVSCEPITVTVPGTTIDLNWDLNVLDASPQERSEGRYQEGPATLGSMTVTRGESHGGTFEATLPVNAGVTFSTVIPQSTFDEIFLDTGSGGGRGSTSIGAPGFDAIIIQSSDLGLPSGGQTTLTQLPSGDWHVDSFFDITYRIDFVGDWSPSPGPGKPDMEVDNVRGTIGDYQLREESIHF